MAGKEKGGVIAWFIENPVAANLLLFGMIALGIMSVSQLRKESFPSIEPDRVTVSVTYNSGDPKQAEEGIALKVEDALQGVSGIKRVTSTSTASGSTTVIEKESSYSLGTLMDDVKTSIDSISNLPSDAENPVVEKDKRADHAIYVTIFGDADRMTLQDYAEKLKLALQQKSNIRDLDISAQTDPYISIDVNQYQLQKYDMSLSDINNAINNESSSALTTSLRNGDKAVRLKVMGQKYNVDEFKNIPLKTTSDGTVIYVKDVANVYNTFDNDSFVLSRYNGQNAMSIEIVMDEYGDVTKISDQANEVVKSWQERNVLPENVHIKTWFDQSDSIKSRLDLLVSNALSGMALVFALLAIFLNVRVALWVVAGLPFISFGAFLFMGESFANLTINSMTTFGFIMALGIVVDDAVVVGESVYETRKRHGDTVENTIKGTMKVAAPTVFGVLTTVAAFMALVGIEGNMGKIFSQFAIVVTICLLLSLVESKFILPSHLAHLDTQRNSNGLWSKVQGGADKLLMLLNTKVYEPSVRFALKFRYMTVMIFLSLLMLIGSMPFNGQIKMSFFPDIPRDMVTADLSMQDDVSFGKTHENMMILEKTAQKAAEALQPETESHGIDSLQVIAESDTSGTVTVAFKDATYSSDDFSREWRKLVPQLDGMKKVNIASRMEMVSNFKIQLKSSESEKAMKAGEEVNKYLKTINGVTSTEDNLSQVNPVYKFEVSKEGRALGLDSAAISDHVFDSFGGGTAQKFQRNQDEVSVSVRYPEKARQNLTDIMNSNIELSNGNMVPFKVVATVTSEYQTSSITRIDNQRAIYVSASVDKSVITSNELVKSVKDNLLPKLRAEDPLLDISFAGEAEEQAEAVGSMEIVAVGALLAIYALLAIPLKSYIQPIIIMTAIPFGIVGALLGHYLIGMTLSILSMFGILALSGVVVNDSLLLVSTYNDNRNDGMSVTDAIVDSCTSRLRAVLLTSLTTFGGLVPLLSETAMNAQFLKPAAASLGFGIIFATFITLLLIPAILKILDDVKVLFQKA